MILAVQTRNYKTLGLKAFSYIALITMFYFYYNHMSDKFSTQNSVLVKKLDIKAQDKTIALSKKLEKLIFKEAEMAVDLLGQTNVKSIKIQKSMLYIICDYDTDLEPLLVRYGVKALVKSSVIDIKIALDLKFIVESKYEK